MSIGAVVRIRFAIWTLKHSHTTHYVSFISHNQVKYHEMNLHAWIDIAIIKGIIGSWISKRVF